MTSDRFAAARLFRIGRIAVLALVITYFLLPYGVRSWFPVWLLFLLALGLEIDFFVGGWLQARTARPSPPRRRIAGRRGATCPSSAAGATGTRPSRRRRSPPSPAFSWLHVVEAVAAIAIVGILLYFAARPSGWNAVSSKRQAQTEAILSREASAIAHHPATVTCDKNGDFVGFVQDADGLAEVGGDQAFLTPAICDTLYQLAIKHRVQSFSRTARAIAVLGHESWHLRGEANEGLANCYGFQSGVGIGVNLGLSESRARAMMQRAARDERVRLGAEHAVSRPERLPERRRRGSAPGRSVPVAVYFSVAVFGALNGVSMARTGRKLAP